MSGMKGTYGQNRLTREQLEARASMPKPKPSDPSYSAWWRARVELGLATIELSMDKVNVYQRKKYAARKMKGMVRV